jgi:hypothetical protein
MLRVHLLVEVMKSADPSYANGPTATWSALEVNIGVICACLPPLRALAVRIAPSNIMSYGSRHSGYQRNTAGSWKTQPPAGGTRGNLSKATASVSEDEIYGLNDTRSTSNAHPSLDGGHHTWLSESDSGNEHKDVEAAMARNIGGGSWPLVGAPRAPRAAVTRVAPGTVSTLAQGPATAFRPSERPTRAYEQPQGSSFGTYDNNSPWGNEIHVSTRVQQTVD